MIEFDRIKIDLHRTGDTLSGEVRFPPAMSRDPVPVNLTIKTDPPPRETIELFCARGHEPPAIGSEISNLKSTDQYRDRQGAASDRSGLRVRAVAAYRHQLADPQGRTKLTIAKAVAAQFGVSPRSIQLWARSQSIGGDQALAGKNGSHWCPTCRRLDADPQQLDNAVTVCAWWSFRIPNIASIQNAHVAAALQLLDSHPSTDVIGTIDYYYGYSCDRKAYPFKPLSRWSRYDFERWLHRARNDADYAKVRKATRADMHRVSPPSEPGAPATGPRTAGIPACSVPDAQARRREVASRQHRVSRPRPPVSSSLAAVGRTANMLSSIGLPDVADNLVRSAANPAPTTIDQALTAMPDALRVMLLRTAQGDNGAREQAIKTLLMWWDYLPETVRNNTTFHINAWRKNHPRATTKALAARKVDLFICTMNHEHGNRQPRRVLHKEAAS